MDNQLKKFYKDHLSESAQLPDDAKQRVKNHVFANLNTTTSVVVGSSFWQKISALLPKSYAIIPIALLLFITGTTIVSAHALPGDTLYPVKRQIENVRVAITPGEDAKLEVKLDLAQKRLEEFEQTNANVVKNDNVKSELEDSVNHNSNSNLNRDINHDSQAENKNKDRRAKARTEVNHAFDFLKKTRKNLQDEGKNDKAQELEDRIKEFRNQLEDRSGSGRDGNNRGSNDYENNHDSGSWRR